MSDKQWYVAQNGQSIGPMSQGDLVQKLESGAYSMTDHVFTEGMKGWVPASSMPDFPGAPPAISSRGMPI